MLGALIVACCLLGGFVHSIAGEPLAGARISLHAGDVRKNAVSDAKGRFTISAPPAQYQVDTSVSGYRSASVLVALDRDRSIDIALEPVNAPTLRTIAVVTVDGRLTPILGTIPSLTVTRSDYERLGYDRIVQGLQGLPSATFAHPDGGSSNAIAVVALRGPDPSESLIALDRQLLNDGNTGDLDLSRLPVAAFSAVNVTEGLGPEDSNGSNTFGGAINLVSLRPTRDPHAAFSLSGGSFGQSEGWINATGTQGRFGYAFAADDQNQSGYVNQPVVLNGTTRTTLGSSLASHAGLANLTWSFSQRADVTARVFLLGDVRDQSASVNGIDEIASDKGTPLYGQFIGPGNQSLAQVIRAYQVTDRMPLGAGELSTDVSESDNSVTLVGNPSDPAYDLTHQDRRYNGALNWERDFATSQFAVGGYTRYETLNFGPPVLGQTINVLYARGGFQPAPKWRIDGGLFESRYTSFGSNLDGRIGAVYTSAPNTTFRFSAGTGFRAPLLIERYLFPLAQLAQDGLGVFVGQGNPNEKPEHATEYELGMSHEFTSSTLDVSLYRTNLRNPVEIYYPIQLAESGGCLGNSVANPVPGCVSFNSNVGNAVYEGAEIRYAKRFVPEHMFLTAMYGLNVAYPKNLNAFFSNPTSAANLVDNQQFPGIPQQQGSLEFDYTPATWHAAVQAIVRGKNNELNLPPFTTVNAAIGKRLDQHADLTMAITNVFNAAVGPFTRFGAGVPYNGLTGPLPTDALYVEPMGVRAILTVRN
ncbi:MAG TPA: TonB-dependent receptor [Candidatus Baltobacteraceae bacterium]|nr:TonB-dependent receptor [Candidatus Baltobacteraceae bacterium]